MTSAAPFDLVVAGSVDEAVDVLAGDRDARVVAGGQSLVPLLVARAVRPTIVVDVNGAGLGGVAIDHPGRVLRVGATVRQRTLERSAAIAAAAPLLAAAAAWVGHPAVRHRGTLGGSLAHADPAAELPAAVVALGGDVVVAGPSGTRRLAAADLATGAFATALAPGELVVEVTVPLVAGPQGAAFCEWAPRHRDRAEAGVGVWVAGPPPGADGFVAPDEVAPGVVASVGAAACGIGDRPVDLTEVLDDALRDVPVASGLSDALVRHVAGAVAGTCREHGADVDRAELAGALAARAAVRAMRALAAGGGPAPGQAVRAADAA